MKNTDVLVIGTGIAGLSFAIKVALLDPSISITLISKTDLNEGNTRYAQGGIAVVSNLKKDSPEKHIRDTEIAGDGLCDPKVVQFVIQEGSDRLQELIDWGTQFDRNQKEFHLAQEGGHSENRIIHYKDHTGLQIQKTLIQKVKSFPKVTLLENHTLVDLITDHHHCNKKYNRCYGAYVISKEKEKIIKITAKITALCSGGAGTLYKKTTNSKRATADGLGAAYRAKVQMKALPYIQFHPTALWQEIKGQTFLITEALRGEGALLKNTKGERFMANYHKQGDLAPRDIVARGIYKEMQKEKTDFVYLDCSKISLQTLQNHFPKIFKTCKTVGIHLPKDPIPVVPATHYFCGGIQINSKAESQLKGLYAIGECSASGLHGANRLASNSLLEAIVFAHRAAMDVIVALNKKLPSDSFFNQLPKWKGDLYSKNLKIKEIQTLRHELQSIMTQYVGIFKTNNGLKIADKKMNTIYTQVVTIYNNNRLTNELCELRNMVSIAHLIIKQAREIKINKGVFFNEDYA